MSLITRAAKALLILLTLGLAHGSALAATPANGTLTTSSGDLKYTAGPFFFANTTGTASDPVCKDDGASCDKFELTVQLPDDYDVTHPEDMVEVGVSWPDSTADFDLYIYSETGSLVARSAGSSDPEVAKFLAGKGIKKYTVVVIPFAPLGQSIEGRISLKVITGGGAGGGAGPVPLPPAASGLPPRFINYVSPPGLADNAGEPTMGWNQFTQRAMFVAYTETDRVTFPELLSPPLPQACDALWENKSYPAAVSSLDPILETEKTTGRTFSSQLTGANSIFAFSDDDGENWTPGQIAPPNGGPDHQSIFAGPYPAGYLGVKNPDGYAVYYCSQGNATAFCARSDTGGVTFGPGIPIRTPNDCTDISAIHGHVQVAPDGTVYVPNRICNRPDGRSTQTISVSTDAGQTWVVRDIPGTMAAQKDPAVGVASDGTIYACYEAPDHSAHAVVSKDQGRTWSNDYNISARAGVKTARFVTAVAGDPDRAACAFIGTDTAGNSEVLDFTGYWYPYVAATYDGGHTWHTVNVSPNDPVQGAGGVCVSGLSCNSSPNNRNLLDFNDIIMSEKGFLMFAYADGCIGDCVRNPAINSFSDKGVIARQTGGRGLLAAFDGVDPQPPKNACLSGTRTSKSAKLFWRAPDDGGAGISNYKVFRSSSPNTAGEFIGDAGAKQTFEDTSADPNVGKYYYTVVAQNPLGSGPVSNIAELPVGPEPVVESSCTVPGVTALTDPEGDATNRQASYDILSISAAEPANLEGKLALTMKVKSLATLPPNTFWAIRFNAPTPPQNGDAAYFVAMHTEGGTARFVYGTSYVQDATATSLTVYQIQGDIDPASAYNADGSIVLVADKALFGGLKPGDALAQILGTTRIITQTQGPIAGGSQDTADGGSYVVKGTEICKTGGGVPPERVTPATNGALKADTGRFGGALGLGLLLPLLGMAVLYRRKR